MSHEILNRLIDAVEASPNNGPLRCYLAETLLNHQRWGYAANQYLAALNLEDVSIERARFGLAKALFYLDKPEEGLELVESLLDRELSIPIGPVHLLHSRLLLILGEYALAVGEYIRAIDGDPMLVDDELAEALGLQPPKISLDETAFETDDQTGEYPAVGNNQSNEQAISGMPLDGTHNNDPSYGNASDEHQEDESIAPEPNSPKPLLKPITKSEVSDLLDELDNWIANPYQYPTSSDESPQEDVDPKNS